MPVTKNALIRYYHLDKLLSDSHHYYDRKDLTEKVNDLLAFDGFKTVEKRTIEKDIVNMQDAPFNAPIKEFKWNGKNCVTYSKRSFSIFKEELSDEEENLLREVLSTIGQFDGLDNFKWLDDFKIGLGLKERRQIISFSNNPYLQNSNLLGTLFDMISNEVVIRLYYHTFSNKTTRSIDYHPYLLKQYNDRWFLFGAIDGDRTILTFAIDRIDKVEPLPERKYVECPENLSDRFEDIVGVTFYKNRPIEHILFGCSDFATNYVSTKPLHGSQIQYKREDETRLRETYPVLENGSFFSIDCMENPELIRLLSSYGSDLVVLEPTKIQNVIIERIYNTIERYNQIRTH